jgi:hypothetical protein
MESSSNSLRNAYSQQHRDVRSSGSLTDITGILPSSSVGTHENVSCSDPGAVLDSVACAHHNGNCSSESSFVRKKNPSRRRSVSTARLRRVLREEQKTSDMKQYIHTELQQLKPKLYPRRQYLPVQWVWWILIFLLAIGEIWFIVYVRYRSASVPFAQCLKWTRYNSTLCEPFRGTSTERHGQDLAHLDTLLGVLNTLCVFGGAFLGPFLCEVIAQRDWYLNIAQFGSLVILTMFGYFFNQIGSSPSNMISFILGLYMFIVGWFGHPATFLKVLCKPPSP